MVFVPGNPGVCYGSPCIDSTTAPGGDPGPDQHCDAPFAAEGFRAPIALPIAAGLGDDAFLQWDGGGAAFSDGTILLAPRLYLATQSMDVDPVHAPDWFEVQNSALVDAAGTPLFGQRHGWVTLEPSGGLVLYQPVQQPTGDPNYTTIMRVTGIDASFDTATDTVSVTEMPGGDTIGSWYVQYARRFALGIDPNDDSRRLAADVTTQNGMVSWDGNAWVPVPALTDLVTRQGSLSLNYANTTRRVNANAAVLQSQVTRIAYDHVGGQTVLVGTEHAGIMASQDGGSSWDLLCQSDRIPRVSDFFFDEVTQSTYAASYGRSIWRLDLDAVDVEAPVLSGESEVVLTSCDLGGDGFALPAPEVTDDCTTVLGLSAELIATSSGLAVPSPIDPTGIFLPPGTHVVRWSANDGAHVATFDQTVLVVPGIFAGDTLDVRNGAQLLTSAGAPAAAANTGAGETAIGIGSLSGELVSVASVKVDGGSVQGPVTTAGGITLQNGGTISGLQTQGAMVDLPPVPDLDGVVFPAAEPGFSHNSGTLAVMPGSYGDVFIDSPPNPSDPPPVLEFVAGDYYFERFMANTDTLVIRVDQSDGPVRVFVQSDIALRGRFETPAGELAPVFIGYRGTNQLTLEAPFLGFVVAPNATVEMGAEDALSFSGSFAANTLRVRPNVTLTCVDSSELGLDGAGPAPLPSCMDGAENGDEEGVDCGGSCPTPCSGCTGSTTYQAENMAHSTGGSTPGGWNIWSNGFIAQQHVFTEPASITVVARGESAQGVAPHMVVTVGGTAIGEAYVAAQDFTPYPFTYSGPLGSQEIRVVFDNDLYQPEQGLDRNLLVDAVSVGCSSAAPSLTATVSNPPTSDWGSGYCMTIFVTNNGTEPATGWSVVLDMNQSSLGNYWNSDFSSTTGIVTATPSYSWDPAAVIAPGETSSAMGFCANRFNPSSGSLASVVSVEP